jgi:hypothetical protein
MKGNGPGLNVCMLIETDHELYQSARNTDVSTGHTHSTGKKLHCLMLHRSSIQSNFIPLKPYRQQSTHLKAKWNELCILQPVNISIRISPFNP